MHILLYRRWGTQENFMVGGQPDDENVILEQTFDHERGAATGILRFNKLKRTDDGLYQCLASNKAETDYRTGHVTVQFAPNFDHMQDLPPVYTWEERVANLSCLAQGKFQQQGGRYWIDYIITKRANHIIKMHN